MGIVREEDGPRDGVEGELMPQAGESLRRELDDLVYGRAMLVGTGFAFMVVMTGLEWYRYVMHMPPTLQSAVANTVLTAILGVIAFFMMRRTFRQARAVKLGLRGERHVGRYLEDICRGEGYRVLHDVPGEGFNVDHVLIGPGGIFSIETKNWTKPAKGKAEIVFDGEVLRKPDGTFDREAAKQAKAGRDFVRKLLMKRTGWEAGRVPVVAVLLLPGWWVDDRKQGRPREIWVLPDGALHQWLRKERVRLRGEEVALLTETLGEYVRNFGK